MTEAKLISLGLTLEDWESFGPLEKLFLDIGDLLGEIQELRWIDIEAGQLEMPTESYPVQFPCALIDFPDSQFQDETHLNQQGLIQVAIRLGIDLYEDLHMIDGNDASDKGTAVKRLNLSTRVHQKLQGFETDYSSPLVRRGIQSERRDDGIKVFQLFYECAAKDDSAAKIYNAYTEAQLHINKA